MKTLNNNIQETYCSPEVSRLLKEKGFNCLCDIYIFNEEQHRSFGSNSMNLSRVYVPSHSVAIEWIRVNFGIWVFPILHIETRKFLVNIDRIEPKFQWQLELFNSPQEATEAALLYTLQNLI